MKKGFIHQLLGSSMLALVLAGLGQNCIDVEAATKMTFKVTSADFGANGTDLKADSAQIQKALDMAKSVEGTVKIIIPAGTYYLDESLMIYSNTDLILEDETVIKRYPGYSSVMLMNGADFDNKTEEYERSGNFTITGGTWDGTVTEGALNKEDSLFYFGHAQDITISDVQIQNGYGPHLIEFTGVKDVTISNKVTLKNYLGAEGGGQEAIAFRVVTDSEIGNYKPYDYTPCKNITVKGCTISYPSGIGVTSDKDGALMQNIVIEENILSNLTDTGILLQGCSNGAVTKNTITGSPDTGIGVKDSKNTQINANTIQNCIAAGIYAENSETVINERNVLSGCSGNGISIKNPVSAEITANRIMENTNGNGISVINGNSFTKIKENYITDVGDYGIIMYYGNGSEITNNTITNFKKCGISIQKSLTENERSSLVKIHSNKITNGETGIEVLNADTTTVSNNIIKETTVAGIKMTEDCENSVIKNNNSEGNIEIEDSSAVLSGNKEGANGLAKSEEDGQWYYYKNGKVDTSYNGLVQYENVWYYIENGVLNWNFKNLYCYKGIWYYINGGKVDFTYTNLVKYNGAWYYVKGGTIAWNHTGLVKNSAGWFYVKNGKIDWSYTGLVKHNGVWFYVKGGVLDFSYTGLAKHNGAWYYMKNGVLNWSKVGLVKHNGAWYYVKNGIVDWSKTGLVKNNGAWFYVRNGKIDWNKTGLVKHNGSWFYEKGGL